MAEQALVPEAALFDVADGVEPALAAALGNAGLAAWLALEWRARLQPGETVLVLGATGTVGRLAVQSAKALGAGRVIAAARDVERLAGLGADAVVGLDAPEPADVIIDPLWGEPALAAMRAARPRARHVQVGHMASATLELPAPLVRSGALDIMGFAGFQPPPEVRRAAYLRLTELAGQGAITLAVDVFALADVAQAWERQREGPQVKLVIACH